MARAPTELHDTTLVIHATGHIILAAVSQMVNDPTEYDWNAFQPNYKAVLKCMNPNGSKSNPEERSDAYSLYNLMRRHPHPHHHLNAQMQAHGNHINGA